MFQLTAAEWKNGNLLQNATGLHRTSFPSIFAPIADRSQKHRDPSRLPLAFTELALQVEKLSREVERRGGTLAGHHEAIQVLLDQIRRLTQFPETPKRGIGFTAPWKDAK